MGSKYSFSKSCNSPAVVIAFQTLELAVCKSHSYSVRSNGFELKRGGQDKEDKGSNTSDYVRSRWL